MLIVSRSRAPTKAELSPKGEAGAVGGNGAQNKLSRFLVFFRFCSLFWSFGFCFFGGWFGFRFWFIFSLFRRCFFVFRLTFWRFFWFQTRCFFSRWFFCFSIFICAFLIYSFRRNGWFFFGFGSFSFFLFLWLFRWRLCFLLFGGFWCFFLFLGLLSFRCCYNGLYRRSINWIFKLLLMGYLLIKCLMDTEELITQ